MLSAPYARWLARRHRVLAWKLPERPDMTGWIEQLRAYEMFSRDEWLLLHEECFDVWRGKVLPGLRAHCHPPSVRDVLGAVDFSTHLWQLAGIEFERAWLFLAIARRHARMHAVVDPCIVAPAILALAQKDWGTDAATTDIESRPLWDAVETLGEWLLTVAHAGRLIVGTARAAVLSRLRPGPRAFLWRGISPREIPSKTRQVDFAWATSFGWLDRTSSLYFPPVRLTEPQRVHLRQEGIAAVEPLDEFRILPRRAAFGNLLRSLACVLCAAAWRRGMEGAWLARLAVRGLVWGRIAKEVGARHYLTTTSASWPEQAEVAVLKRQRVTSITWAYSANSLTFAWNRPGFRDVGIARSLLATDEFWVWNASFQQWLENRRTTSATTEPRIRIVGSLMCGDSRLLKMTPTEARAVLGLPACQFLVGVFDMPAISVAWKQRHGGGPSMIEPEYYARFFRGILRVLQDVPDAAVMLKLKRSVDDWTRQFPDELKLLLDDNGPLRAGGRVHIVDSDVDPYLPVACSEMTIGMPYTSPVLVGLAAGRPGCYFDPSGIANWPSAPALRLITLQDSQALVEAVRRRGGDLPCGEALGSIIPPLPDTNLLRNLEHA